MDYSTKVTVKNGPDQEHPSETQTDAASPSSSVELPESAHPCPACPSVLATSRELTNHLRGHNSPRSTDCSGEEDYSCGVCRKVLSSASSLDRHVLVHSGERPFKCKNCEMAFTTNGNMNRHLRTAHGGFSPHSCTDSEGSSDSEKPPSTKRQHIEEYNNNEIAKRNSPDYMGEEERADSPTPMVKRKRLNFPSERETPARGEGPALLGPDAEADGKNRLEELRSINDCPVCGRQDFATIALLEAHLERCHPEFPAKCDACNLTFKNHRVLNLHRFMIHFAEHSMSNQARNLRNSIVGFHDLTFVDFSSDKFPAIARAVCERSMHRPASGEVAKFQCSKCLRGFPCRSALDAHESDCGNPSPFGKSIQEDEEAIEEKSGQPKRDDFFAGLDLQNKAALAEAKEGKDLADIQSIISITSGPILQNFPRSDTSTPEHVAKVNPNVSSSGSSGIFSSEFHEEEAQDAFAAEFRKMKLKGEFPCRLCTAVFPNLRALKGHNRNHMGVSPGMPYPCNMCPYTSTDKATLVRHLRSHNGDRPYECSLCNYAFTTKANCERHVRNRHGKLTREDIKSVLIYHPNEDSTNEGVERTSPRVVREDARKILLYPQDREDSNQQSQLHFPPMSVEAAKGEIRIIEEAKLRDSALSSLRGIATTRYENIDALASQVAMRPLELTRRISEEASNARDSALSSKADFSKADEDLESRSSESSVYLVSGTKSDAHQRIQASPINLKKAFGASFSSNDEDDVPLDLSKKSEKAKDTTNPDESRPDKNSDETYDATSQLLLTQALLNLESIYANAHLVYRNFGTFSGILPPYLFDPRAFGQDFSVKERLQKELVRGLQLTSGGSLVEPPPLGNPGFEGFSQSSRDALSSHSATSNEQSDYAKLVASKIAAKAVAARDKSIDNASTPNSVKMVIKNGVLMPKQKQRRYRTERPFTCEHCSARFTLRSNMERHIKQQHPQHWSQRPRGGHSTRGRPPSSLPTLLQNLGQSSSQLPQTYPSILPKVESAAATSPGYSKHPISEQVKYAILAQQLKANRVEENDSDEELVIDEEPKERENREAQDKTERSTSLLREHLENAESSCKENVKQDADEAALSERNDAAEDSSKASNVLVKVKDEVKTEEPEETQESQDANASALEEKTSESTNETSRVPKVELTAEEMNKQEDGQDLASVSELLEHASQQYQQFQPQYLSDEEGLVASTSDNSGSDDKSDSINSGNSAHSANPEYQGNLRSKKKRRKKKKKKSAYSLAPNRVLCPFCDRPFPWSSSLRRHILTHTGQKPFQCPHCDLLFTTKSNCDRHLLRKHKSIPPKVHCVRNSSSPEAQPPASNDNTFSMRNVPERPYKCNQCPSSTFSTLGNLKKHKSTKHSQKIDSRPDSPSSEPQHSPLQGECSKRNDPSDYESRSSSVSEGNEQSSAVSGIPKASANPSFQSSIDAARSRRPSPRSSPCPSDVPFKCHLCDSGFAERQDCLEHIKFNHKKSYEMLVAKGALDMDIDTPEDQLQPPPPPPPPPATQQQQQQHASDGEEKRGRFPDYSNRKVVCAFCMRRFWSAEDLRRHMRTHTGERPFSCDICYRRFTLKHSMLRHRKKHESIDSTMYVGTSGDEEPPATQGPISNSRIQDMMSLPSVAPTPGGGGGGDGTPSALMRFNPYDALMQSIRSLVPLNP